MLAKTCQGCGKQFEALKANRKWCSDLCGKRARRHAAVFPSYPAPPPIPATNPVNSLANEASSDTIAYLRNQLAFARAVVPDVVLPVDLVDHLLLLEDEGRTAFVDADYEAVERVLVGRAIEHLEAYQSPESFDDAAAAMALLTQFWSDMVDDRVVTALARSL